MSLLKEIRNQPEGVRKAMFALSLVAVMSFAGALWFSSFQHNVYALLNPDASNTVEGRQFAQDDASGVQSPFAAMGTFLQDFRANITGLFSSSEVKQDAKVELPSVHSGKAQALPISQ